MLDVLFDYELLNDEDRSVEPKENYLPDLRAYRDAMLSVGFTYVRIDDCTDLTGKAACSYVVKMLEKEFGTTGDPKVLDRINYIQYIYKAAFAWGMVYAIK